MIFYLPSSMRQPMIDAGYEIGGIVFTDFVPDSKTKPTATTEGVKAVLISIGFKTDGSISA